jgi:DNA-binding CsgD family transcriptional regulator
MGEPGRRVAHWFAVFSDLVSEPATAMPTEFLLEQISRTFPVAAVSLNSREHDGTVRVVIRPSDALDPLAAELEGWRSGDFQEGCHPLLTWYARTGDWRPHTNERVPTTIVSRRRRAVIHDTLGRIGLDQQLAINYRLDGAMHRAFVLGRGGRDFSDEDIVVAGYVQRALVALDAQTRLVARLGSGPESTSTALGVAADAGLTGRELAVLQLLADGCATRLIGRRLGCSPRTVEKHLERVFRKLGVRDRVNALRVAQGQGLVSTPLARSRLRAVPDLQQLA